MGMYQLGNPDIYVNINIYLYNLYRETHSGMHTALHIHIHIYIITDNVTETTTFKSSVTSNEYKINHSFNCNEKCLLYLLTCKTCKKQYVDKTCDSFRFRWNSYKDNNRKFLRDQSCMQQHIYEHFSSEGHCSFLDEVSITFIDKTDPKDPNKREHYWRHALKTMAPD